MLRRIESIKNAAVWSGYNGRESAAPDFERYNLLYGWNASGKTTLSRVFNLLSESGDTRLPAGAHVRMKVEEGVVDSGMEPDKGRIPIRVFNRDFIDDNLQLDDYTLAPALFIVGSQNIRLSNRIEVLKRRREKLLEVYRAVKKKKDEASSAREKAATDLARECGSMLGVRDFRAPNLKVIAQKLDKPDENLLGESELQAAVSQARDQSNFVPFASLSIGTQPQFPDVDQVRRLLRETPQQSAIKRLSDDPALSDWVRTGLQFHKHDQACAFCGGDAAPALEAYAKHFSDAYNRQHSAITAAIGKLEQPRKLPTLPHEMEWVPEVRHDFRAALRRLEGWYERQEKVASSWITLLQKKLASMETALTIDGLEHQSSELDAILTDLRQAKNHHDRACKELAVTRRMAADNVKTHFAARYLLDEGAIEAEEAIDQASEILDRVEGIGRKISAQMTVAQSELQRSSVAANRINDLLRRLLGSRISVQQADDNKIRFIREGKPATNPSDGERTAIALAYFLVSLEQNGQRIDNLVVFVDDPICSLDANHIYDVAYLLMARLKSCKQLFISTHNSEFFNTIKQEWTDRGKFKKGHTAFLVHRDGDGASRLLELPAHLAKFRSDYHHVFYCLRQLQMSTSPDVNAYISCPNLLRRFLEMYLGFRKPTAKSYSSKLDILFKDEVERSAIARYVDEGSHSATTLKLLEYSDFPAMSRGMVERVMRAIESVDPEHYEVLIDETD